MRLRRSGRAVSVAAALFVLCACGAPNSAVRTATVAVIAPTLPAATVTGALTPTPRPPYPGPAGSSTVSPNLAPTTSAAPSATPSSAPAIRQLTRDGCCVQPFWSPDSRQVRYIDRPSSGQPSGIWAVSLAGGEPSFVTARLGIYSPDERLVAYPASGQTYIERVGGERWTVPTGGRAILFSPDSAQIAWQVASSTVNFDSRQVQIWVAAVDGSSAHKVADLVGGGLTAWIPDGQHLLVTRRESGLTEIALLKLADGALTTIAKGARVQSIALSPLGGWVAYTIAFSGDPSQDCLCVAATAGEAGTRLDSFGAFAWRTEGRLLVIPLEPSASSNRLVEFHAENGFQQALTDPSVAPFRIAGGNWALSPDGQHLAFVAAADHNLWVLDLPE